MQKEFWVFFDKDGTLIDLDSIWIPWAKRIYLYLTNELEKEWLFSELVFLQKLGVNSSGVTIDVRSPLAIGSIQEAEIIVAFLLYQEGIGWDRAMLFAKNAIRFANEEAYLDTVSELPGIRNLITTLFDKGIKMGVLTADTTHRAQESLSKIGLSRYFEFILGSDLVEYSKPFPDLAYLARDNYQIDLSKVVMIGDSNADMLLAKNAGLSKAIGLLQHSDVKENVLPDADVVISSYSQLTLEDILGNGG